MHKKPILVALLVVAVGLWFTAQWLNDNRSAQVTVEMTRTEQQQWLLQYTFAKPVQQATFIRNPDSSRQQRWQPLDTGFYIGSDAEQREFIARADGQPFQSVAFQLNPTYVSLRKDYAPFMPFSDGGVAWFTGRFKICPEHCQSAMQFVYAFTMRAPIDAHILIPEQQGMGALSWQETSATDGSLVYVGPQQGNSEGVRGVTTLLDPQLPTSLQQGLATETPALLNFYNARLPSLTFTPMVLASYSATDDGRYGYQGGVVNQQMTLHWYGAVLSERLRGAYFVEDTLWFVAHEFAHLYQAGQFSQDQAWIHEGAAEFMAAGYLQQSPLTADYTKLRFQQARQDCAEEHDLIAVHYACGLVWSERIDAEIRKRHDSGLFFLWYMYIDALQQETSAQPDYTGLYYKLLGEVTSEAFATELEETISARYRALQ